MMRLFPTLDLRYYIHCSPGWGGVIRHHIKPALCPGLLSTPWVLHNTTPSPRPPCITVCWGTKTSQPSLSISVTFLIQNYHEHFLYNTNFRTLGAVGEGIGPHSWNKWIFHQLFENCHLMTFKNHYKSLQWVCILYNNIYYINVIRWGPFVGNVEEFS